LQMGNLGGRRHGALLRNQLRESEHTAAQQESQEE
jgi:hypothetical protein